MSKCTCTLSGLRVQNRFGGMRVGMREILKVGYGMKWTKQDWDMLLFVGRMQDVLKLKTECKINT